MSISTENENSGYEFGSTFAQIATDGVSDVQSDVAGAAFTFLSELKKKHPNVDRLPPVLLDLKPQTWKNFHSGGQQSIIVILLLKRVPMGLLLLQIDTGHYILNNCLRLNPGINLASMHGGYKL
ncbi:hypothetical protein A3759_11415 [Thalassolituus sp. HI0120]|nr:hypothetical protein A3759_11415 [Thalassolituus sp. HI0120]